MYSQNTKTKFLKSWTVEKHLSKFVKDAVFKGYQSIGLNIIIGRNGFS
jgi:hypothetical protein